jgi:hypothetical protein
MEHLASALLLWRRKENSLGTLGGGDAAAAVEKSLAGL